MIAFWKKNQDLIGRIYIPKYYDPDTKCDLLNLKETHNLIRLGDLAAKGILSVATGNEIGKLSYGTGDIPFVRTSDISNWEIRSIPKQGVSAEIYAKYVKKQDVREGDILLVRDGTYLIGTNCFVSALDTKLVYQSHILKLRLTSFSEVEPFLLFLALNSDIVQRQIRSIQFTADTIDTIGNRYLDLVIPVPKKSEDRQEMIRLTESALSTRIVGKAFIKQAPFLLEEALRCGDASALQAFLRTNPADVRNRLRQDTVTAEFGSFNSFWLESSYVRERVLLPKYYNPEISEELGKLSLHCECRAISQLIADGVLELSTGDEIGKMAYGTGEIPFLRTSDFANWEIKHDPKQGISEEIYYNYARKQDLKPADILLVRDGTYLVGSSCIVTEADSKALFCGGLYKIRSKAPNYLDPFLLLGLLNSYIVKRQIRTKQFTRDVIDTIGQRLKEVVLPIPRSQTLREELAGTLKQVVDARVGARLQISELSKRIEDRSTAL